MGTVVIEYTGEILTTGGCEERYRDCPELRSYECRTSTPPKKDKTPNNILCIPH
jgi:hypothetical protein